MSDQRKTINYVRTAGLSKGYYLHVLAGGGAFLGILFAYAAKLMNEVNLVVATIPDAALAASLQDRLMTVAILFFVCFVSFILCTVFYIVVLSHRVGGPIVAIVHFINELKKGNYDVKRNLRKNDELVPVMFELQELAKILKGKGSLNDKEKTAHP
jgi:signal transduction histidine kinase